MQVINVENIADSFIKDMGLMDKDNNSLHPAIKIDSVSGSNIYKISDQRLEDNINSAIVYLLEGVI